MNVRSLNFPRAILFLSIVSEDGDDGITDQCFPPCAISMGTRAFIRSLHSPIEMLSSSLRENRFIDIRQINESELIARLSGWKKRTSGKPLATGPCPIKYVQVFAHRRIDLLPSIHEPAGVTP